LHQSRIEGFRGLARCEVGSVRPLCSLLVIESRTDRSARYFVRLTHRRPRWKTLLLHMPSRLFSCGGLGAHGVQAIHSPTWQSELHAPRGNVQGNVDCCGAEPQVPASAALQRPVGAHEEPSRCARPKRRIAPVLFRDVGHGLEVRMAGLYSFRGRAPTTTRRISARA
jgi:hypothetical protein